MANPIQTVPPPDMRESTPLEEFLQKPAVRRWGPFLAIAVITFLFLMPSIRGMYIWDDSQWLTSNPTIPKSDGLVYIWTKPAESPHYYPLVFSTYWLEYRLWGYGSADANGIFRGIGYHADNLLLHIGSALLIFAILKRLKLPGGELGAWLAAVIFGIHPVNVESVAWVAERKNCLCGVFFFAAMYFGLRFFAVTKEEADALDAGKFRHHGWGWGWYAATLLFFLCAMLSKTVACIFPPALLVLIWWRRGKITLKEIALTLPIFAIAILMSAVTVSNEAATVGAVGPEFHYSLLQRILIAGNALWFYVQKLLVPTPVMQIYPRFPIVAGQPITASWLYIAPILFPLFLIVLFLLRKRITRGPIAAMLFFAGVLFPALGFLNFYTMVFTFVADHYQYLACIGVIVLAVETLLWIIRRLPKIIPTEDPVRFQRLTTGLIIGGIVLSFGTLTYGVSNLYTDSVALWVYNADNNPNNFYVWDNIGTERMHQVPPDEEGARTAYLKAIEIAPNDWRAYHQLGLMYLNANNPERAAEYLDKGEALMPEFVRNGRANFFEKQDYNYRSRDPRSEESGDWDQVHSRDYLLARNYEDHAQWDKAIASYSAGLQKHPDDAQAWFGLGNCYIGKNDFASAVAAYQKAIAQKPTYSMAYVNMGLALRALHRDKEALDALQTARRLDPMVLSHIPGLMQQAAEQMRNAATQK
ncbi:MAG TPA: tetratricopeptide repeat protein [Phycisphaerae bacterium]|nr:tetratricopeptide repeat protein [Phycisphaerae bacterium]